MQKDKKNTAIYVAYDDQEPFDPSKPEKELLRAVLLAAMADLQKPGAQGKRAMEYFLSPDEEYLYSFHSVCNFLNLDPATILIITGLKKPRKSPEGLNQRATFEN